ncbi:efflux RND transporter permease subunit, partial [Dyadobacter jiangsuensis]
QDVIKEMEAKTKHITDAEIQFFPPPTVPGFGNSSGFELRVQDRSGNEDLQKTAEITNKFVKDLAATPEIAAAFSSFDASFPQYMIHVDSDIAAKKGVSVDAAMGTLQTMIGSYYASNFIRFGQMYKVMVQADASFRKNPEDILKLYVKNNRGEMVPFSTFIK